MHNNIMAAGSRDRPPMLATRRYPQWKSRFLRYIDTRPNSNALRKCILEGPYQLTTVIILVVPTTNNSLAVPERTAVETILTMSPENKAHFESKKEAIHLLLTRITDEIYSTVDACKTAHEMFMTIVKQKHDLDTVSYQKLFDVLKQYQKEVNEIRAKRIASNANPLAFVATAQQYPDPYYQIPNSHKPYSPTSKQSSSTRSNESTKFKGKEIDKPITPPSESAFEKDSDPEQAQRDKDMQKNLALIAKYFKKIFKPTNNNIRTSSNSRNKNVDTNRRYKNDNQTRQFRNQRTVTVVGAKETVGSKEVRSADSETDTEPLEQVQNNAEYNVFSNEIQHYEQPKSINNTCVMETGDSNVIPDSPNMCDNDIHNDQNTVECEDERVALANLIANLKLDVDENKKIQKQLKKENTSLNQELKECKYTLARTSRTLGESNSIRDSCLVVLQNKQTEFERYKAFNDHIVDYDKLEPPKGPTFNGKPTFASPMYLKKAQYEKPYLYEIPHDQSDLANRLVLDKEETLTLEKESQSKLNKDLVRPYDYTKLNSLCEIFKPVSQEYNEQLAHANKIRKKMWRKSFVKFKPNIFKNIDAHSELQCLYLHKMKECECLKQKLSKQTEFVSKEVYTVLLRSFAKLEKHFISLKLALQQCQEQMKNDTVCKEKASNVFQKEHEQYFEIQDLKAQLPQLRRTQMKDKVVPNNSQVKDKKVVVEDRQGFLVFLIEQIDSDHFACVNKLLNDMNARTKKPNVVRICTRKPKGHVNKSVATPPKKIVASESTTQKSKSYYRMLFEKTSTVHFGNDQFALILSYGDLVQGNIMINRVYYVEGLNHNLFSVGQFCDANLEVAFWKSTCFVRVLQGINLLTDKMKEKGDSCILVGYSTQSNGYYVYNKRTRLIVESIHRRFNEIKEMYETSVANDTSGLIPQRQKAANYDNSDPAPHLQNVSPSADTITPSQQELDLLFGPLYNKSVTTRC
nr:integrase, catalytic region, zinc finger, CCHC-type, peptidase aspartic, catalytic [Tanacetum cinerariifolium]GEV43991.1 integrase, catalytic region, zinc finger, CCHC-type, peptidase aspartic, catalytic [Tanacetum cinerariifolium]